MRASLTRGPRGREGHLHVPAPAPAPAHAPAPAPVPAPGRRWHLSRGFGITFVVGLLCVIGLMMVLSASATLALRANESVWAFFQRQLLWLAMGALALALFSWLDYRWLRKASGLLLVSCFVLLVAVRFGGVHVDGSTRWLSVGGLRFQPSEVAKLAAVLFAADLLDRRAGLVGRLRAVLLPLILSIGSLVALVVGQPDLGTGILIVLIVLAMLFVGGFPLKGMATVGVVTAGLCPVLAMVQPYQWQRVMGVLRQGQELKGAGYQLNQSLVAMGSGHLYGVGLGASRAKLGFLPNAHTDFIFAIIGEELGLIGTLFVLGLFALLAYLGIGVALRAPDRFGALLAAGATAWLVGQALVNMGAVTGVLPVTGVPLPFVSFGGTALMVGMVAVGILVNVAGQGGSAGTPARAGRAGRRVRG